MREISIFKIFEFSENFENIKKLNGKIIENFKKILENPKKNKNSRKKI